MLKKFFENVNRQTEALTLVLSCGVERKKEQNFLKHHSLLFSPAGGEKRRKERF